MLGVSPDLDLPRNICAALGTKSSEDSGQLQRHEHEGKSEVTPPPTNFFRTGHKLPIDLVLYSLRININTRKKFITIYYMSSES